MTLIVAIVAAAALLIAQPPARPATTQTQPRDPRVQLWLDRAEKDVRDIIARPMPEALKHFGTKVDLALALVQTRGSEPDKKLLRDAMAQPLPTRGKLESPELRELSVHYLRGRAHAALGETDVARAEAEALDRAFEELPNGHLGHLFGSTYLTAAYVQIGDIPAARAAALKHPMLGDSIAGQMTLARELHAAGNRTAHDQTIADAIADAKKIPDATTQAGALRSIVAELAEIGDLEPAMALARQMPMKHPRVDAYRKLAAIYAARGDAPAATACVNAALDTLVELKDEASTGWLHVQVGELAVELDQPDAAKRAVAAIEKEYNDSAAWTTDAWTFARAARIAAAAGDQAACARLVKASEQVIDRRDDAKERSGAMMVLAAAVARAGDKPRATELLLRAKKLHAEEDYENVDALFDALDAFMEIGDAEYAHQLAMREFGLATKDLEYLYELSLDRHLRAGEFDAARAQAMRITNPSRRFRSLLRIALRQARANKSDSVAEWISALPDADDRAALYLALVQQSLGIDPRGWLRAEFD